MASRSFKMAGPLALSLLALPLFLSTIVSSSSSSFPHQLDDRAIDDFVSGSLGNAGDLLDSAVGDAGQVVGQAAGEVGEIIHEAIQALMVPIERIVKQPAPGKETWDAFAQMAARAAAQGNTKKVASERATPEAHAEPRIKAISGKAKAAASGSGNGNAPVTYHGDWSTWFANISIGTPPQTFVMEIDTGSGQLVLPVKKFDCKASSTCKEQKQKFSVEYQSDSSASGPVISDTVSFENVNITGQYFGATDKGNNHINEKSGIVGFNRVKSFYGQPSFFSNMCQKKTISPCQMSLYLSEGGGSEITFGPQDKSKASDDPIWTKVVDDPVDNQFDETWLIRAQLGKSGAGPDERQNITGYLDTGAPTTLAGDSDSLTSLFKMLDTETKVSDQGQLVGYWTCDKPPAMSFWIEGQEFPIQPEAMTFGKDEQGNCLSSLFTTKEAGNGVYSIGDQFMRSAYVTFSHDKNAVGFAKLK